MSLVVKLTARDAHNQLNAADASPLPLLVVPLRAPPNNGNRADCGVSRHEQAHAETHPRSSSAALALKRRKVMATKKRAFISFDIDHDEGAKKMLAGQAKLPDSPFDFKDNSVKEYLTGDWKEKVRRRMDNVDVVIVLCGTQTHTASGVAAELTIAKEKKKPYFLLAAYSDKHCTKPTSASPSDKVYKWTWDNLKKLIGGAR